MPKINANNIKECLSSRRNFIQTMGAGFVGVSCSGGSKPNNKGKKKTISKIRVARMSELIEGEKISFEFPKGHNSFIVKLIEPAQGGVGPGEKIVAFQRACPHMGCPIDSEVTSDATFGPCRCHQSLFDLSKGGRQIHGMASQPLVQVELELDGEDIYAIDVRGLPFGEALAAC